MAIRKIRSVSGTPTPVGPYSPAVSASGLLFVGGQIGIDPASGKLVSGGVEAEARRVLQNLTSVLSSQALSFADVVMTTIFLADMAHYSMVNEVYKAAFEGIDPPARQTVAVRELPGKALIEISLIAALRS
jgi:2-iminobutanoate/2-iminopropanoate deaminase